MGAYSKGVYLRGGLKIFLVVDQIPGKIFLLINYFFDDILASNSMFSEGQANFR